MGKVTAGQMIDRVDAMVPNVYSREEKLRWLREAERSVVDDVLRPLLGQTEAGEMTEDTELLAQEGYEALYRYYLEAQIHYANGEMTRCNNAVSLFNRTQTAFRDSQCRGRMPVGRVRALRLR